MKLKSLGTTHDIFVILSAPMSLTNHRNITNKDLNHLKELIASLVHELDERVRLGTLSSKLLI